MVSESTPRTTAILRQQLDQFEIDLIQFALLLHHGAFGLKESERLSLFSKVEYRLHPHFPNRKLDETCAPLTRYMTQRLEVQGMSCEGCETTVEEALKSVDGVTGVQVDWDTDLATITGEPRLDDLEQAVTDAGYEIARSGRGTT